MECEWRLAARLERASSSSSSSSSLGVGGWPGESEEGGRYLSSGARGEGHINIRLVVNASGCYWRYVSQ
jgi:hypothetical protein